ncbi:MAG: aminobenzoate oxygenase, partial [Metallosphaera sp.]
PELKEKEEAWRTALVRVGATLARYGVKIPAIPELGITGEEIEDLKEDDFIPVF